MGIPWQLARFKLHSNLSLLSRDTVRKFVDAFSCTIAKSIIDNSCVTDSPTKKDTEQEQHRGEWKQRGGGGGFFELSSTLSIRPARFPATEEKWKLVRAGYTRPTVTHSISRRYHRFPAAERRIEREAKLDDDDDDNVATFLPRRGLQFYRTAALYIAVIPRALNEKVIVFHSVLPRVSPGPSSEVPPAASARARNCAVYKMFAAK